MAAISTRTGSDFDMVKSIAGYCNAVDPSWHKGLRESGKPSGAVKECHDRLNALAPKVTLCCAIVFPEIRARVQRTDETNSVVIHHKNFQNLKGLEEVYGQIDYKIVPADTEVADFYLLHKNKICHYQLDPRSSYVKMATSYNPEAIDWDVSVWAEWDVSIWDLSLRDIDSMSSKAWNGSFISTSHLMCPVMLIPTVEDSEMKQ